MNFPRLIALDLDGTLLPADKRLTPRARRVLGRLKDDGCRIVLATGKFLHLARRYAEELDLQTPVISLNGARIDGPGRGGAHFQFGSTMARHHLAELFELVGSDFLHLFADSGCDELLLRTRERERLLRAVRDWADGPRFVEDMRGELVADPAIAAFYGDVESVETLASRVGDSELDIEPVVFRSEMMNSAQVVLQRRGADKGSGLGAVLDELEIRAEDAVVFGDFYNDLPMFQVGCFSVAMCNAVAELRDLADDVTQLSCEEDGVAEYLERHYL